MLKIYDQTAIYLTTKSYVLIVRQIHNNTQGIYTYICHSNDNKT